MKAKELYLKKELTKFDVAVARTFLANLIGTERAKRMNLFSLTYFEFEGNQIDLNGNENNFKYLDLGENIYIQGKYFSKIAFMAGDGDIILSLIDDDFNNVAGLNITQSLGISQDDEYKFNREKDNYKKENYNSNKTKKNYEFNGYNYTEENSYNYSSNSSIENDYTKQTKTEKQNYNYEKRKKNNESEKQINDMMLMFGVVIVVLLLMMGINS